MKITKKQHLIPNFLLKQWGYEFVGNNYRNYKINCFDVHKETVNKIKVSKAGELEKYFVIKNFFYEIKDEKKNLIEKDFFSRIESKMGNIIKKIKECLKLNCEIKLSWKENYIVKIFSIISLFRTNNFFNNLCWVKENSSKIENLQDLPNPEFFNAEDDLDPSKFNFYRNEAHKIFLLIKEVYDYITNKKNNSIKPFKIIEIINAHTNSVEKDMRFKFKSTLWEKYSFDSDFKKELTEKYPDEKIQRVLKEQLCLYMFNPYMLLNTVLFNMNINFLNFKIGKLFMPETIVTPWIDMMSDAITYFNMPITPNLSIFLTNSIFSQKITNNGLTEFDKLLNTSWNKLSLYIKKLFIDKSKVLISTLGEETISESKMNYNMPNDNFFASFNAQDKNNVFIEKNNNDFIIYYFTNCEEEINFFNHYIKFYCNNYFFSVEDNLTEINKYTWEMFKEVEKKEPDIYSAIINMMKHDSQ